MKAAEDMLGPNVDALKCKTTKQKPNQIKPKYHDVPYFIIQKHRSVTLSSNVMFVNMIPFMLTVICLLQMGTSKNISSTKSIWTINAINALVQMYTKRGLKFTCMLIDEPFEPLRVELVVMCIDVNIAARKDMYQK